MSHGPINLPPAAQQAFENLIPLQSHPNRGIELFHYTEETSTGNVNTSGVLAALNNPNARLTNESMMYYLKTRLDGLDSQIDAIFEKQQKIEKIRDALSRYSNELGKLENGEASNTGVKFESGVDSKLNAILEEIKELDPVLGKQMQAELKEKEYIGYKEKIGEMGEKGKGENTEYTTKQVENSKEYVSTILKKLESSSQLEMISLQSFMSSRQQAIQLATNLVAAMGESLKGQVAKIG